jgi:Galactose oxidase, central domain
MSKIRNIFFLILTINLFACEDKEALQFIEPEVFVSTAYLKPNETTIEVNCETINPSSVNKEEFGICWAEKPGPVITDNYQYSGNNSKEEGPFVEQILNVKPNTKYYIRGFMRVNGRDVYSKDFIYDPVIAKGWYRLQDIPRIKDIINLPIAFLQNNAIPTFKRKLIGFEESYDFVFNDAAKFWSGNVNDSKIMVYDQFTSDIEYAPGKFDFFLGGGYQIENSINGKRKFLKKASTSTYPTVENYPGADVPAVAFGAGNKGFVIEVKANPNMYAFNEENFLWEKMKSPPFANFTNIKATRANGNGIVILENALANNSSKLKVYFYEFKTDTWQQLDDFPGLDRIGGILFSIKNKVYFGLGEQKVTENGLKDMWEYDLDSKTWTQIANYPGSGSTSIAFVRKENSVFIGMGYSSILTDISTSRKFMAYDFWEFRP